MSAVGKIEALLALADEGSGASEEEARTAAVQAVRLLKRSGLCVAEANGREEEEADSPLADVWAEVERKRQARTPETEALELRAEVERLQGLLAYQCAQCTAHLAEIEALRAELHALRVAS